MSSDLSYLSVSKFVGLVLEEYPRTMAIEALFEPEHQKPDKYKQFFAKPFGLILRENSRDKPTILKFETMVQKFGQIAVKFTESKYRKINFRSTVQMLRIKIEEKTFAAPEGKEITYFPSTTQDASGPIPAKLLELRNEYVSRIRSDSIQEDLDNIV